MHVTADGCANKASLFFLFWFTQEGHKQAHAEMTLLVILCVFSHVFYLQVSSAPVNNVFKHLQNACKCFRSWSAVKGASCLLLKLALCISLLCRAFAGLFLAFLTDIPCHFFCRIRMSCNVTFSCCCCPCLQLVCTLQYVVWEFDARFHSLLKG